MDIPSPQSPTLVKTEVNDLRGETHRACDAQGSIWVTYLLGGAASGQQLYKRANEISNKGQLVWNLF